MIVLLSTLRIIMRYNKAEDLFDLLYYKSSRDRYDLRFGYMPSKYSALVTLSHFTINTHVSAACVPFQTSDPTHLVAVSSCNPHRKSRTACLTRPGASRECRLVLQIKMCRN